MLINARPKLVIKPAIRLALIAAATVVLLAVIVFGVRGLTVAILTTAIPMAAILILAGPVLTRLTPQGFVVMEVQPPVRI